VEIAGIEIDGLAVLGLAERLVHAGHSDTAALLLTAQTSRDEHLGLTVEHREAVLAVLRDPPDGLRELRAALMVDDVRRVGDGLV